MAEPLHLFASITPQPAAFSLPDWMTAGDNGLPVSGAFAALVYWSIILLLFGLLLHLRRKRLNLEQEALSLRKYEAHLRALGENLSDITIFQLEQNTESGRFRFNSISKGCEQIIGLDCSSLLEDARLAFDHIYDADIPLLKSAFETASIKQEAARVELRILDAGGSRKWLRISAIPHLTGRIMLWDGYVQDISSLKETEQSIVEESRNFQNLFETIDDFLMVCDPEGNILHANPAIAKRSGYSLNELNGMTMYQLYPEEVRSDVYRAISRLQSEPAVNCDHALQTKRGEAIPVEMNLFQGTWEQRHAVFGVARDITRYQQTEGALRESQRMMQLIIDTIPMSIFWKDEDSVYLGCNRAFIGECNLNSVDEVVGKTPFDLFEDSMAANIAERDRNVMWTNEPLLNASESHTRHDGSMGWREVSLVPLRDDEGMAVGVLGVWRDVTEQNRAEERLKRTLDDMERFNQLMRGRERRTLELKAEINDLLEELGKTRKYRTTSLDMT